MILKQIQDNAYPATAVGDCLDKIVQTRGLTRKQATAAVRKGTFNTAVPSGSEFKTINGADSQIFVTGDRISGGGPEYVYAMQCKGYGNIRKQLFRESAPKLRRWENLTSAVLGDIIMAGTEEETDEALRSRFYETFDVAAFGGNISSYKNEILSIEGVGAVQVYPAWKGGGTVLCSILGMIFGRRFQLQSRSSEYHLPAGRWRQRTIRRRIWDRTDRRGRDDHNRHSVDFKYYM